MDRNVLLFCERSEGEKPIMLEEKEERGVEGRQERESEAEVVNSFSVWLCVFSLPCSVSGFH